MRRESRNILGWLGMQKEKEAIDHVQTQIDKVCETVSKMKEVFVLFASNNLRDMHVKIKEVAVAEHEADIMRRNIMDYLSDGMLLPPDREDLIHLGKALDSIADWANAASRLLNVFEVKLPDEMCKIMVEFSEVGVRSANKLKEALSYLGGDIKKVLSVCTEVEILEEQGDDYTHALRSIMMKASFEPPLMLMTHELINCIEGVTDRAEDAADLVRVLAVKYR